MGRPLLHGAIRRILQNNFKKENKKVRPKLTLSRGTRRCIQVVGVGPICLMVLTNITPMQESARESPVDELLKNSITS